MLVSFLTALVVVAAIELVYRLMQRSSASPRRTLFQSSINIISLAAGVPIGSQLALNFESVWQRAVMVGLSVGILVAVGQLVVYYYKKAQQNTPTDRA